MPFVGQKKTTRETKKTSTVVRKSRQSRSPSVKSKENVPALAGGQKLISTSNHSSINGGGSDSDSDDEWIKYSEALPASDVTIYNEYAMGPAFGRKFPLPFIRYMVERILHQMFKGKSYQIEQAAKWVREVADEANTRMNEGLCRQPRYKHVIQAIIYQQNGAGFFCGARTIWDELDDDYACCTYDAGTFVCIVMVFGLYTY